MAGANLLTLLDDIATLLDDVAVLSKVAMKKTTGVLADDLALNAEQVSGVKAERELPVIWAVAKGSFLNKLFLVPGALLISWLYPPLITVLLIIGGAFLCYEGAEKLLHKLSQDPEQREQRLEALQDDAIDLVALEKEKIKGAIRTDFILSAEIVVIVLGTLQAADFTTQVMVLSGLAFAITVGIYGFVALIVKLDDMGLFLVRKGFALSAGSLLRSIYQYLGRGLLILAPNLMKLLSIFGTLAMFLVGGGILTHSIPVLHALSPMLNHWLGFEAEHWLSQVTAITVDGVLALAIGALLVMLISVIPKGSKNTEA